MEIFSSQSSLKIFRQEIGRYVTSVAVAGIAWQITVTAFDVPKYLLPRPLEVIAVLFKEYPAFIEAMYYTSKNMLVGGSLGIIAGMFTALILASSKAARWILEPYLSIFQSFPRESLLPLLVVWIGFGAGLKIINAMLLAFFPVSVISLNALVNTRKDYIELVKSWGMTPQNILFKCRLMCAVPSIISSAKLALPYALIGSVLGEFMGGNDGLGNIIMTSSATFRLDRIFASILLLALLGTLGVGMITFFQNTVFKRFYLDN